MSSTKEGTITIAANNLTAYLQQAPQVAEPDVAGSLAVFPLIGPMPVLEYQSFAQGSAWGVTIKELDGGASVRDLLIQNPTDLPVLLFEGEEVLGAQQNRTFDVSVLVPAKSTLRVPVSCVESGRWDGSRHLEEFAPAPQAAHPSLRRMKNAQAAQQLSVGLDARADQGAVWEAVDEKLDALSASAPTRAMHDGYEQRRVELDAMRGAVEMKCSQTGMLVAIGGEFTVLDRVSQPDVLDSLFGPLVQGYALDALGVADCAPPSLDEAQAFLARVLSAPIHEHDGIGAGREVRVADHELAGAGVLSGTELVQLSVFVGGSTDSDEPVRGGRIRRPSRRRA